MMELKQLTKRIFYLPNNPETDRPILSAICGDDHTLLIDAGNSSGHANLFLRELAKNQISKLFSVELTHWHWDHSFGAAAMKYPLISHEDTKSSLEKLCEYRWSDEALNERVANGLESPFCAEMIKKEYSTNRTINIVLPQIIFKEQLELNLTGIRCIIKHVGGDHSSDSSIIFVEEEKVLFLGDCLYPSMYTQQPQYTVKNIRTILDTIELYDADWFVLSHQEPLSKEEFEGYQQLLRLICDVTEKYQADSAKIVDEVQSLLKRNLTELEEGIVHCFINGI